MTKPFHFSILLFVFAPTAALAAPSGPNAGPIVVATADLDLGSESGRRLLDRRLSRAVIDACGTASVVDLAGGNGVRRCRDQTRAAIAAKRDRLVELASRRAPLSIAAVR